MENKIVYLRLNGEVATNQIYKGGYDQENNEIIFLELVGQSLEVKGGVKMSGEEKFKRLFVQRVYPHIKI